MARIVVIGSSNTDMVVKTSRFPGAGETILGGAFFMFPGGKGANQAVAAARMGGSVCLIAKVGDDVFGQQAITGFEKEGIDTIYIQKDPAAASGVALITVDEKGENSIVVAPGANNNLHEKDITEAATAINEATALLLQLEVPVATVCYAAKQAYDSGRKVILNPAPAGWLPPDIFPTLYLITPNETEASILTNVNVKDEISAEGAADVLLSRGVQNVIITLGAKGAYFKNRETSFLINTEKVEAVDTTAAGDVFNGALAVALAEGQPWPAALRFACCAATLSVTRMGAQSSAPYREEVEERLRVKEF